MCIWGVGMPGVAALLPSSSGELHQQQGWDSADLQEELWLQHTAGNLEQAGKAAVFSQDLISVLLLMLGEKACWEMLLKNQGRNLPTFPTPPTNRQSFRAKMCF